MLDTEIQNNAVGDRRATHLLTLRYGMQNLLKYCWKNLIYYIEH